MAKDRDAKKVQAVTGAAYQTALTEVLRRRRIKEVKIYMVGIKALPIRLENQPQLCVRCLAPVHGKCDR